MNRNEWLDTLPKGSVGAEVGGHIEVGELEKV